MMSDAINEQEIITEKIYEVTKINGNWKIHTEHNLDEPQICSECVDELTFNNYGGWIVCDACFYDIAVAPEVEKRMREL